ncbi:MAG: hypothetical protein AAGI01_17345, partial [Myxococcota bacterium]
EKGDDAGADEQGPSQDRDAPKPAAPAAGAVSGILKPKRITKDNQELASGILGGASYALQRGDVATEDTGNLRAQEASKASKLKLALQRSRERLEASGTTPAPERRLAPKLNFGTRDASSQAPDGDSPPPERVEKSAPSLGRAPGQAERDEVPSELEPSNIDATSIGMPGLFSPGGSSLESGFGEQSINPFAGASKVSTPALDPEPGQVDVPPRVPAAPDRFGGVDDEALHKVHDPRPVSQTPASMSPKNLTPQQPPLVQESAPRSRPMRAPQPTTSYITSQPQHLPASPDFEEEDALVRIAQKGVGIFAGFLLCAATGLGFAGAGFGGGTLGALALFAPAMLGLGVFASSLLPVPLGVRVAATGMLSFIAFAVFGLAVVLGVLDLIALFLIIAGAMFGLCSAALPLLMRYF